MTWQAFESEADGQDILEGVGVCAACRSWFPISSGVLDLLVGPLAYAAERRAFFATWRSRLEALGCQPAPDDSSQPQPVSEIGRLGQEQQKHSDWFAEHETLSYSDFANTPFWRTVDAIHFADWLPLVQTGDALLEAGCAQGRTTFAFAHKDIDIVGFDVSRKLVHQARARFKAGADGPGGRPWQARMSFMLADACAMPLRGEVFNAVLVYGVLHHVPDPSLACHEVLRVLRKGGRFFGSENNVTVFRKIFDALMVLAPLWKEEAGPEALISERELRRWFDIGGPLVESATIGSRVFIPPHLANLFPDSIAGPLIRFTDFVGNHLPFFRGNGGLIHITLRKAQGG